MQQRAFRSRIVVRFRTVNIAVDEAADATDDDVGTQGDLTDPSISTIVSMILKQTQGLWS